jgi:chromate transport protein ChrA
MSHQWQKSRSPVLLAQVLFVLNAIIWILLGVFSLIRLVDNATMAWILAALMFANAAVMLWIGWGLGRKPKPFYNLALAVLAVNLSLTVTDEFGFYDLIVLLLDAGMVALLVFTRAKYLSAGGDSVPAQNL